MNSALSQCDAPGKEVVRALILGAGAARVGFARCHDVDLSAFDRWVGAGMHGSLDYMARNRHMRLNPAGLLEGCRTVISIAFPYFRAGQLRSPLFADYALGDDYHEALRGRLEGVCEALRKLVPGSQTRICVDSAPILERSWAVEAGVGFIGLNRQLIVPGVGSKVFLCEILWTAELPPDAPCTECCVGCGKCVRSCPAGALSGEGVDARRCLSALSVEHRGELPEGTRFHGRICGCDICQDVCPHNATPPAHVIPEFEPRAAVVELTDADIAAMDAETFARIFRHSAVKRLKLAGLKRNREAR